MGRTRTNMDLGLLLLRLALGAIFIVHGGQKAFGWFGGGGPRQIIEGVGQMGFQPAEVWGWMVIVAEFGGGIGILLGFLTPLWALGIISTMAVAIWKVHGPNGFMLSDSGYEYNLALMAMAACLLFAGPGRASIDYLLFGRPRRTEVDITPD